MPSLVAAAEDAAARNWDCLAIEVTSLRTRSDARAFYPRMGYTEVCDTSGRFLKALPHDGAVIAPSWPGVGPGQAGLDPTVEDGLDFPGSGCHAPKHV